MGVAFPGRPGEEARTAEEIAITISPHTLILGSDEGNWVTVHTDIPLSAVACGTLELNEIGVAWTKADALGNLVAKFRQADIKAIVSPPQATLTLTGETNSGVPFTGSDTIQVKDHSK